MTTPARPDARARRDAQRRADRIRAFQEELRALEEEGVSALTPEQRARIEAHHAARLASLQQVFDIDRDAATQEMSYGMRAASFFGAAAFSAAVFSFFYRIWGDLSTVAQVIAVTAATILAVIGIEIAARRERSGYIAAIVALVACACFVLQLIVFGQIFNMRPSAGAFLVWAAFGLAIGYAYGLWLPSVLGVASLGAYIAMLWAQLSGGTGLDAFTHPELVLLSSIALLIAAVALRYARRRSANTLRANGPELDGPDLDGAIRLVALLPAFAALLVLTLAGNNSLLSWPRESVQIMYQVLFLPVAIAGIALGLRRRWPETYRIAATFLGLFLLTRFVDWCWEWMPKYLFFLILGALAIGLLFALRRVRRHLLAGAAA